MRLKRRKMVLYKGDESRSRTHLLAFFLTFLAKAKQLL
jgi:hypothetical protein